MAQFLAMQRALFITTFVVICSGCLFLFASLYINEDADKAKKLSKEASQANVKKIANADNLADNAQPLLTELAVDPPIA